MKSTPTYPSADDNGTIPLKSREHFKFYEPLILLRALNDELRDAANYVSASEECNVQEPRELFQGFVNKLALVCDSAKGENGAKVTAVWVSEDKPGNIKYHLTSNQRDLTEVKEMVFFVNKLLRQIDAMSSSTPLKSSVRSILSLILCFNRPRINLYLDGLRAEAIRCRTQCLDSKDENEGEMASELKKLLGCYTLDGNSKDLSESDYTQRCESVIQRLIGLANSSTGRIVEDRGREGRKITDRDCWSELRYNMNRLLAYRQAVSFFLRAKTQWPCLFGDVEVIGLPSSKPSAKFLTRNKSLTADSIVGRLTRKEKEIQTFRTFVKELQLYDLDGRIVSEFTKEDFRPVVHAEPRMLNHIEFTGGVSPERFFKGWMYIGSSKPTCRLCHYYFVEHGSGVGHRATHGNLYTNWRFPDVTEDQGEVALAKRTQMLTKVLAKVRTDAFNLVRNRAAPTHRSHDSATSSARMTLEDTWSVASPDDDIVSMVSQLESISLM